MIEIRINKDIGSFQPKIMGPFNGRQVVCVTIGGAAAMLTYFLTEPFLTQSSALFLTFIPASVAVLFGWIKPFGIPMERFLKSAFVSMFLAPSIRRYKTAALPQGSGPVEKGKKKRKYKPSRTAVR